MAIRRGSSIKETVENAVGRGVLDGGNIVKQEALRLVRQTPKTGAVYTHKFITVNGRSFPTNEKRPGGPHQASAPGEPYAADTGTTDEQIDDPVLRDPLTAVVSFRGENARRLEFGTENMAPRPVARPALDNTREEVRGAIVSHLRAGLGTRGGQ